MMADSSPYLDLLAVVPAFGCIPSRQLETLYGFCSLRVLAKGETATVAGVALQELRIVASGRVAEFGDVQTQREAGPGTALDAAAFFTRAPSTTTYTALRETLLLILGWDDLLAAFRANPDLLASCFLMLARDDSGSPAAKKPRRLAVCPAGGDQKLDPAVKAAILSGLESAGDIRLLGKATFGGGMPGAITLNAPETAHWLQEQEMEFDLTAIIIDGSDPAFARETIEEADEILFVANGGAVGLSSLEEHALSYRGPERCRLAITKQSGFSSHRAADWAQLRPYRSTQAVDFASDDAIRNLCFNIMGAGNAVAATSRGVYAAAILGGLQAFEANGKHAVCLAAAGSAVLPAGLLASGASLAEAEAVFSKLADPALWKRATRLETSVFDPASVDQSLLSALPNYDIATAERCFAVVSHSLSTGRPEIHREGRLQAAVRAGLLPQGLLPPIILEDGTILVSGEHEIEALLSALSAISASPVSLLMAKAPALGLSATPYRHLSEGGSFRLTPFQSQTALDRRVRLDTVLGALPSIPYASRERVQCFAIPIPDGILPTDWSEWSTLRDLAFEWVSDELERLDGAGIEGTGVKGLFEGNA